MKTQPFAIGHTINEYLLAAALVGVVAIGALTMMGKTLNGQFNKISQSPSPNTLLAPIAPTAGAANGVAVTGSFLPGNGAGSGLTGLPNYQAVADSVQTAGANGTTDILADKITALANQLVATGQIDQEQANQLIALANQGHKIAAIQKIMEVMGNDLNTQTDPRDSFYNQPITYNGESATIYDMFAKITFDQDYPVGILADPLTYKGGKGPEMETLISMYNDIASSGMLNAANLAQLRLLTSQIATISDALTFAIQDRQYHTVTASNFTESLVERLSASKTTNNNSGKICVMGNGQDSGTNCKP